MVRSLKLLALVLTLVATMAAPGAVLAEVAPGAAPGAPAQDARDFSILNLSDSHIVGVYVSHTTAGEWGNNWLSSPVDPGEERFFYFDYPSPGRCTYWVYIESETAHVTLEDVDLCNTLGFIFEEATTTIVPLG